MAFPFRFLARLLFCLTLTPGILRAADDYRPGPEAQRKAGVPEGRVESFELKESKVFPGTERNVWVYIPRQYDGTAALPFMIFQDGGGMVNPKGSYRVPIVFDNLIHQGDIPVMAGIFVNPGTIPSATQQGTPRRNRSFEYDTPDGRYASFLIEELIPEVRRRFGLNLSDAPDQRVLCGNSSGGICAFTAAWERPDQFGRVVSHIGSFTNIRGGHDYPALIRKTDRKPLRVFLQDGTSDLDNMHGHWPLANRQMAAALQFKGYDHKLVLGPDGGHNGRHSGSIFPDTLRWIWRE